jgi:hypothetical protein
MRVHRSVLFFGSAAAPRPLFGFCFPLFFRRSPFFCFIAFLYRPARGSEPPASGRVPLGYLRSGLAFVPLLSYL